MFSNGKRLIGICTSGIDDEYNGSFLKAFTKYASAYDFKLMTFYTLSKLETGTRNDIGEANIFELINYAMLDGLIIMAETIKSEHILTSLVERAKIYNVPVVSIDKYLDGCCNISFNYDKAMEDLTRHLVEVHHYKVFNFISGIKGNEFSEKRLNIFKAVLREYDIDLDERRLGYGEFWGRPTKVVMENFLSSGLPLPDVIVCANDTMASTAFECLVEAGIRVPDDVAVTGFDGISFALNHQPVITTAAHDIDKTATETFDIFKNIFKGERVSKRRWVDSHIIIGGTCGCPNRQSRYSTNKLIESLSDKMNAMTYITQNQVRMVTDLTDNSNFFEIFEDLKRYVELYNSDYFMICVDDSFLMEQDITDIINSPDVIGPVYSPKMNLMLFRKKGEWQGITDFKTENILPDLDGLYEEIDNLVLYPMHVQDKTIGYAATDFEFGTLNLDLLYEFFMNLSTALELKKTYMLQQKFIDSLEEKYVHDPLTQTLNRRGFYMEIKDVYLRCRDEEKEFFIISADLNKLKVINDTYGHSDGDQAITAVANALSKSALHEEVCARFGGDEFIVAGELKEADFEKNYRERVKYHLDEYNSSSGKPYEVTVSIGIVTFIPNDDTPFDKRISEADEKMYKEKVSAHMNRR
ncbi:MAG: GGDEF domain-containing protein [Lachnospiraceae bacterium]|nr:GGDEF domain-containing protein [Lachnospiraceae bacterium]